MTETSRSIARWVTAVLAVLAIALLALWVHRTTLRANGLAAQLEEAQTRIAGMVAKEELETARETITELEKRVADLEGRLARRAEPEEKPLVPGAADVTGQTLRDMFASLTGRQTREGEGASDQENPFLSMFTGEGGKQMADFAGRMSVNMAYGDFFAELALAPEREQTVRDILAAHMSDQISKGMEALEAGLDGEKLKEMEEDAEKRLRDELSRELTPRELAVWDEYAATMDERILGQSYDMQLGMYAPGLTPENREIVRDVLVDEMLAMGDNMGRGVATGMNTDMDAALNVQLQALERARERLVGALDEEQLAQYDQFIETQQQVFEMATQMFGDLFGQQPAEQE